MSFWANVRTVSQQVGYTVRGSGTIRVPTPTEVRTALAALGLTSAHLFRPGGPTDTGKRLSEYFAFRADVLNGSVQRALMDAPDARIEFARLVEQAPRTRRYVMNKQKGDKAGPALFTNMVNMLIEVGIGGDQCNYDPQQLTTVTRDREPLRTLARRVDGAYPSTVNPIAVWEIKEYYHTTTFGSRVADGVYETLLDGLELEELRKEEGIDVKHYLFVDSHYTWWRMGRSYLCRLVDMLHMGYVDEVLFGREIFERLPLLAVEWRKLRRLRDGV